MQIPRPIFRSLAVAMLVLLAPEAQANFYSVTTAADAGAGSLRQAMLNAAGAGVGPHTIAFDSNVFSAASPKTIILQSELPTVSYTLSLVGPGAKLATIGGGGAHRLLSIAAGQTVLVTGLTFADGLAVGIAGADGVSAGIPPTSGGNGFGGAILCAGNLSLTDCELTGNRAFGGNGGRAADNIAQNGAAGGSGLGGAIYLSGGSLSVTRCTFADNRAVGGAGGSGANIINGGGGSGNGGDAGHARGGAIYAVAGTVAALNSTFGGNQCVGGGGGNGGASNFGGAEKPGGVGGYAEGGAIYANTLNPLASCTVAFNDVAAGLGGYQTNFSDRAASGLKRGGGVFALGSMNVTSSIIAKNTTDSGAAPNDVQGTAISGDFNLIGAADGSTGFNGAADQKGTLGAPLDPKLDLGGLQDNGGPVRTIRIVRGSPAADAGKDAGAQNVDQRLLARPVNLDNAGFPNAVGGDGSDIGAFESQTIPNTKPVALTSPVNATAGVAVSGAAVDGSDNDNDTLTYRIVSGTLPSALALNSNGTVTGTVATPGITVLSFVANDGIEDSAPATLTVSVAEAASLVVNTTSDLEDSYDGITSLREAIAYAAGLGGSPVITFDASVFDRPKTLVLSDHLTISHELTINGAAKGVTISGADATNLFEVDAGGVATFRNLTFARGLAGITGGGAINCENGASVTLSGCTIYRCGNNTALGVHGGAVKSLNCTLILSNCTLVGNFVSGAFCAGAAISVTGGTTSIDNCTITGNTAYANTDGSGRGGGIEVTSGTLSIGNSIISGNQADTDVDLFGDIVTRGYNLIGDTTGANQGAFVPDSTDQIGVDPKFDEVGLGYNGGAVQTIMLYGGSAALDKGKAMGGATTDARGKTRPFDDGAITNANDGDGSDIGAFEAQGSGPDLAVANDDTETDLFNGETRAIDTVDVGVETSLGFLLRNKGSTTLAITGVTFSGTDAAMFRVEQAPPGTLAGQSDTSLRVLFTPTSVGSKTATMTVSSNDSNESSFLVLLTANVGDTITAPPTILSPVNQGSVYPMATVSFIIPETALSGSVKLAFNNGAAYEFPLDSTYETAGTHTAILDTGTAGMALGDYSLSLTYRDAAAHPAASLTLPTVHVRPAGPVNTTTLAAGGTTAAAAPGAGAFPGLPADAKLASFGPPATDDEGDMAFVARWTSATGGVNGRSTRGAGLFLNGECLALVGGDASSVGGTNAKWQSFTDPVLDNEGRLACIATLSGVPKNAASVIVATSTGAPLAKIAQSDDTATADGAKFKSFKAVAYTGTRIAFLAQLAAGTGTAPRTTAANDLGIWYHETSSLLFVMREGDSVAGRTIKTLVAFAPGNGSPGCGRGTLVNATASGDPIVTALAVFANRTQGQGLVAQNIDDGRPSLALSLSGDPATGLNNGATFASYGLPARNGAETTAFLGKLTLGNGVTKADASGIFRGPDVNGHFATVVRSGVNAGQAGAGAKFGALKDPVLNEAGDIAFPATVTGVKGLGAQTLWLRPASGGLRLLAQGGADAGDLVGAKWKVFTSLAIAGGGRGPIFAASLVPNKTNVTAASASGVWACDFTGAVRKLFRTNDEIDLGGGVKKKVKSFTLLKASVGSTGVTRSFNEAAQVIWLATFTDKTTAIVTTEVP